MNFRLKAIILLMGTALLGLVIIQFYWIDNAIVLKREEFDAKVLKVMQNVTRDLEEKEIVELMRKHELGKQLVQHQIFRQQQHLLRKRNQAFRLGNPSYQKIEKRIENGKITIIEQHSDEKSGKIITRELESRQVQPHHQTDVSINPYLNGSPVDWETGIDSNFMINKIRNKSEFIDDIIVKMLESDVSRSIEDRINLNTLDSMLKGELKNAMIHTDIEFGIFDYFGRLITEPDDENKIPGLRNSIYKIRMFPNDIFGEPFYLSVYFPDQKFYLLKNMWLTLTVSTLFILLILGSFAYTIGVIRNQKQLSLIKNDFISNMTHELKTPISTISLACEALADETLSGEIKNKNRFLQMISQENKRLAVLVENVLKSSIWDRSDFKMNFEATDLAEILNEVAETTRAIIEKKSGKIDLLLHAENHIIRGDRIHLTNIIHNLIDNAYKYSRDQVEIKVETYNKDQRLYVEISDNGIGIAKDQQRKIFDKFYRVPTGNIHNVKGFGLGLNYVQNVVKNHGGEINVKSDLGKGSCFSFYIPLKNIENA